MDRSPPRPGRRLPAPRPRPVGAGPRRQRSGRPPGYPAEYEEDLRLDDGRTVHLRPVVPHDVRELAEAVRHADPETISRRFLGGAPPRTEAGLTRLVEVDYVQRFALAAFSADGRGVGVARYEGGSTWPVVDLAVAVDRDWRGVGLGSALVQRVVRRAADQGATTVSADFYSDNAPVSRLLGSLGLAERRDLQGDVVHDELALPVPADGRGADDPRR